MESSFIRACRAKELIVGPRCVWRKRVWERRGDDASAFPRWKVRRLCWAKELIGNCEFVSKPLLLRWREIVGIFLFLFFFEKLRTKRA